MTMRNKKDKKSGAGKSGNRRAMSEPAVRDDSESEADATPDDEVDSARYSRIPKRSR